MSEYHRECPSCCRAITYKSKNGFDLAIKNESSCRGCAAIKSGFTERYATQGNNCGKDNAFYGKEHLDSTKAGLKDQALDRDQSVYRTKEFREKISKATSGQNNPMYGRSVYDVWIEKYGIEEADRRMDITKEKHSKNNSGSGNPMYGKPAPRGSGNGWSGWYKGWFFRSIRELSYIILVLEANNQEWFSGESQKWKIRYKDSDDKMRNYFPDFITHDKIIEIKPSRLSGLPNNKLKEKAAKRFAKQLGMEYTIVDPKMLDSKEIADLVKSDVIQFTDKWRKRYEDSYSNEGNPRIWKKHPS
jgi:hypothetical protein